MPLVNGLCSDEDEPTRFIGPDFLEIAYDVQQIRSFAKLVEIHVKFILLLRLPFCGFRSFIQSCTNFIHTAASNTVIEK